MSFEPVKCSWCCMQNVRMLANCYNVAGPVEACSLEMHGHFLNCYRKWSTFFHPLFCQSEKKIRNESMQRYIAKWTVGWTSHDHQQVHSVVLCIVLWWVFLFFCFIQNYIRIDKNIYVCCVCSRYMYQSYTNKMCITCILSTCRLKKIVNCYDTIFVYIFHHL